MSPVTQNDSAKPTPGTPHRRGRAVSISVILAFAFGVTFILLLIVLSLLVPNPTPLQYTVFRVVLSLAAAGVAAVIPGFLKVNLNPHAKLAITAGGALAVFIIVFFNNPARIMGPPPGRTTVVPFIENEDVHLGDNVYPAQWGFSHNPLHMSVYPQGSRGIIYFDKKDATFLAGDDKQTIIGQMLVQYLAPLVSGVDFSGYQTIRAYQGQTAMPEELRHLMAERQNDRFVQIDPGTVLYASRSPVGDYYERYAAVGIVRSVDFAMPMAKNDVQFNRQSIAAIQLFIECYHGGIRQGQSQNFVALVNGHVYPITTVSQRLREKEVVSFNIDRDHIEYQNENTVALAVLPWVEKLPKAYEIDKGPAHFRDVGVVRAFFRVIAAAN